MMFGKAAWLQLLRTDYLGFFRKSVAFKAV